MTKYIRDEYENTYNEEKKNAHKFIMSFYSEKYNMHTNKKLTTRY